MKFDGSTKRLVYLCTNFIVLLDFYANVLINAMTQNEIDQHLEMGKKLLAMGQLADALTEFHLVIDADPKNYMTYYRRATVYLAMGRAKSAVQDLTRVVELKPDFSAARMQLANVYIKQGLFDDATANYNSILNTDKSNSDAIERLGLINTIIHDVERATTHEAYKDYQAAIDLYTKILESSPWSVKMHERRAECYLSIHDYQKAITDLKALSKLVPDNTDAYYRISEISYALGDAETGLSNIRECVKLDSDNKKCSDLYKKLKKLSKLLESMRKAQDEENYVECVNNAKKIRADFTDSFFFRSKGQSQICICSSKGRLLSQAIEACTEVLKQNPQDADALYYRAQVYFNEERLEEALADCNKAHETDDSQRIHECIQKAQKLIKQRSKRDYYKILGVKRTATKKEIEKAYRKLAHKLHPDRFDDAHKEKAQKDFMDIAAAKEVLTDPEKRQRFDNGEDPLDAEEQAQHNHHQGFNPFGHGFNPFGGGGSFHFKFN